MLSVIVDGFDVTVGPVLFGEQSSGVTLDERGEAVTRRVEVVFSREVELMGEVRAFSLVSSGESGSVTRTILTVAPSQRLGAVRYAPPEPNGLTSRSTISSPSIS